MDVGSAWANYVKRLAKLDNEATKKVGEYIGSIPGFSFANPEDMNRLVAYAYGISSKYGEGAAALACEMYDAVGIASGQILPSAEPADIPNIDEVAKAVRGTAKTGNVNTVSGAVGRLVKRTGADTTLNNAIRDGAYFAWIPHGDTCAFCITLASRGWQKASPKALKNGHAEHIHANCDCTYAVQFKGKPSYKNYDPDKYYDMYSGAEGENSKDKINTLRRIRYQENKDRINAQKRAAYAERKALTELHTYNDPIREKLGSAYNSHPNEIDELKKNIQEKGVKIREMGKDMAYCPNPFPGSPGQIKMDPEASYSAWLHEYQHILDDEASGWQGYRLFADPQIVAELEDKAYDVEIDFAKSLGYTKIVHRLEWLKGERRREVYGKPKRRKENT